MEISFFQADNADYPRVRDFYYDLIDRMQELEYHPKWHKGIYPDDAFLESSVRNGEMYLAADGERLVGAMIFNFTANEGYEGAPWSIEAKPGEYASLHALGVMPDMTRRGIGRLLVDNAIRLCAEAGCRTILPPCSREIFLRRSCIFPPDSHLSNGSNCTTRIRASANSIYTNTSLTRISGKCGIRGSRASLRRLPPL